MVQAKAVANEQLLLRLRAARVLAGYLSQAALARKVGVTRNYINDLEQGKYIPSLQLRRHLALLLGDVVNEVWPDEQASQG